MEPGGRRFLRDNTFLVAAVALPVVVIAFFLLATAVPRWLVAPPAYDLLVRATDPNNHNGVVSVDFDVQNGKVVATVRPMPPERYERRTRLFLWDHVTMSVREIAVELPDSLDPGEPRRVVVIDELAQRQALAQFRAPDGYQLESRSERGPGIVGGLFGMDNYGAHASLVKRGRVIPITLPEPFQNFYSSPVRGLGWLVDNGPR